jgi:excisionase family DNA binding protein
MVSPTELRKPVEEAYLSAGDAARLLCVSARTVSRWADQGRIPHLVTLGGHRRFRKSSVLELLGSAQRAGAADARADAPPDEQSEI